MARRVGRLLCLLLLPLAAGAQERAELEVDHALTFEFPTPHTAWARPYARGPTRVLFFTDGRGTAPRWCVELMQRFELEAQAVFWTRVIDSTREQWHGGQAGEARMLELLGRPWDVFVLFGVDLWQMEAQAQVRLLDAVTRGAGLVLVGTPDERVLKPDNRLEPLPSFLADLEGAAAYTVLEGRGVALPAPEPIPYDEGWTDAFDGQAEQVGRALLWAAGRQPQARLRLALDAGPLRVGQAPSLTVTLTGPLAGATRLDLRLRSPPRRPVDLPSRPLAPDRLAPGDTVRAQLPPLPAGRHHIDAWLRGPAGTITWASLPCSVQSERRVLGVDLARDWGQVGDRIAGRVRLAGPALAAETVEVRLLDRRRRVLARVPVLAAAPRFDLPVAAWLPMLVTVEARLLSDGREVDRAWSHFNVTRRHQGRFNFVMWDAPHGTLAPYAEASLAQHGVTVQLGRHPPRVAAAYDVAWVPYTTRIQARLDSTGIMQPFCWNDSAAVTRAVAATAAEFAEAGRHGVFVWSLGDEVSTQGSCLSSYCALAYRTYLRKQYGTLAALNRSWGTAYEAWEAVGLSDPTDNEELGALRRGEQPRWFDRQAFRSWNFVHLCDRYRQAFGAIDPRARVGFEGAGRFDRGDDIDLIVRHSTFWTPYPGTVDEVIRSIAPRDFPRANWMGYDKDADGLLARYWRMVTRGADAVWWWRWDAIGRFHGWLAPDLRPYPAVRQVLDDTWFMRQGLGDLLLRYRMEDDGIAMLYSYPSSLAQRLEGESTFGAYEDAHVAAQRAVRELGLQFRYVTDRMLRRGEFDADRYRVLLLPRAESLSDTAAQVIRRFARAGGLVIADVRPGIFDHHLRRRAGGVLDDLFGIRRSGRDTALVVTAAPFGSNPLRVDPNVRLAGGEAQVQVAGHPVLIDRRVGRGRLILLNFDFSSYPDLALPDTGEKQAQRLAAWLESAGVRPRVRVLGPHGRRQRNVETTRWTDGEVTILSLFRERGSQVTPATVELPERAEVWDVRHRQRLGRGRRFDTDIAPGRAAFFAILPSAVTPALELSSDTVHRGEVVTATVRVPGAAGRHALHLQARCGDRPLPWWTRTAVVGAAAVEVPLPVAYNDAPGTCRVAVTDVLTGRVGAARLVVR